MHERAWILLAALAILVVAVALLVRPHARSHVVRADPWLTPGALNPDVTPATIGSTICVPGWTRTIRPPFTYTHALELRQMHDYGMTGSTRGYEEDHFLSLELGGSPTDPRNLWPEPRPRANVVDGIENDLHAQVCSGRISLGEAQRRIAEVKYRDG